MRKFIVQKVVTKITNYKYEIFAENEKDAEYISTMYYEDEYGRIRDILSNKPVDDIKMKEISQTIEEPDDYFLVKEVHNEEKK